MKRTSRFTIFTAVCVLLVTLSGCGGGGGNVQDFTVKVAGVWQRSGNLQDMRLEILDDGSWTNKELRDGTWEIADQGIISYDKEYKIFNFETDSKFYPVEHTADNGEVLHYQNDNYYRAEASVDGFAAFDGNWYQNGDRDSDYYSFENGEWKWFKPEGMGHVSVDNGILAWDGAAGRLLAYADGEVLAAFLPSDTEELMLDDVPYVLMPDLTLDEIPSAEDGLATGDGSGDMAETANSELPIMLNEFYFLDGELGQPSFFFYSDGQVDYDESYDSPTVEAVYTIDGDQITIELPSGELMGTLGIMDSSVLVDVSDGDIGDFYKLPAD